MRLVGVEDAVWRDAIARGFFPEAPKPGAGQNRRFDTDDLIALTIFRELLAIHMERAHAAGIASDVRTVLRQHSDVETVSVISGSDRAGRPRAAVVITPPGDALILMTFSIATMRAAVEAAFASFSS